MTMNTKRRLRAILIALLCVISVWQFAAAAYIHAKAGLAQWLIEEAWQETKHNAEPVAPWPWADTWPVARLQVPRLAVDQMVLAGASGRNLAFGPTWVQASAAPAENGRTVIAGHRDTHFGFLQQLRVNDEILLEGKTTITRYRVRDTRVVDSRDHDMVLSEAGRQLLLVTCYPFDAIAAGGDLRYLVIAEATL